MASVTLKGVWKRYPGDTVAARDVNLDIGDGDFVVLVGPSGCGKSTTLRMVAGLEKISEGTIQIGDRVVNDLSPRDRDVAMVFQSYALYPHMSVYDNIAFGLKLRKMPKAEIEARIREAAEILELGDLLARKPKALSGGQRQRVAMGRAIVRKPSVFLFDEPLSNLDAKLRVQMRAEIAKLHQRLGVTTIYVTHDQVEAMTLAKHIVVMSQGEVQQVGAPLEVYGSPANTFVAGFIGSPAMNFLDAELSKSGDGFQIAGKGFSFAAPEAWKPTLEAQAGKDIVFGVRPEHLRPSPEQAVLQLEVEVIEPLGAETILLGAVEGQAMTARLEPDIRARVGERLPLGVAWEEARVFDRESGRALL